MREGQDTSIQAVVQNGIAKVSAERLRRTHHKQVRRKRSRAHSVRDLASAMSVS